MFRRGRGLTEAERGELEAIKAEEEAWLAPLRDAEEVGALVGPIIATMSSQGVGDAVEFRAAGYAIALAGKPRNALAVAVEKVLGREVEGLSARFAPTPPELAELTRNEAAVHRRRLEATEQLLAMRELPPPAPSRAIAELPVADTLRAFVDAGARAQAAANEAIARNTRVEADLAGRHFPPAPSAARQEARSEPASDRDQGNQEDVA